ncbi:hypothetical protein FA15DRAFT_711353 [Coprinopsis marcescibilis]|uniref:Uncharacterized protein n=1 Tax=Coprinopsis marcescibilis TaxID=230819 RepID=A0A5C3KA80_COPMA|nr:hypothetical protein FA15DRAFT_711353 [Coprinopsis marcescibilis]
MQLSDIISTVCGLLLVFTTSVSGYFLVTSPTTDSQWVNGQANLVSWDKELKDDLNGFDIKLLRLDGNGIILVARNVVTKPGTINIYVENIQPASGYVLAFVNTTQGITHGRSLPFSILKAGSTPSSTQPTPNDKAVTVSVTSGPDPTVPFATEFPSIQHTGAGISTVRVAGGGLAFAVACFVVTGMFV